MKKVVSILMALVLVLGMVSMAFAGVENANKPTKGNFGVDGYPEVAKTVRSEKPQMLTRAASNKTFGSVIAWAVPSVTE